MGARTMIWAAVLLAGASLAGCSGTKAGVQQASLVREDSRRMERIPESSAPDVALAAMGRKPDAVQKDGDRLIYYFVVRGALNGETLRLVYRDNKLISQSIEHTGGSGE
ncbi:MAG: hypothetical protein HY291_14535 [Planctomycetes bacterium]|nr:hypothetical protein [Planctomycetota bacterium]